MQPHSLDEIIEAAEQIKPPGSYFFKVYFPRNAEVAYKLLYIEPLLGLSESETNSYYIFVNPYTAEATGKQLWHPNNRYWGRPLVSFIMQLHYCLLFGTPGMIFLGIVSALMIISVLTGLILWWPLTGKFHQALSFKIKAGNVRLNYDIHKITGVFSTITLLVVLFSGIYFNLPVQINEIVKLFSTIQRPNAWEGIDSSHLSSTLITNQSRFQLLKL